MSKLGNRLANLEKAAGTVSQKPSYVLHVISDGQVFDSVTDSFYPNEEAFLFAIGKSRAEVTILPLHHNCTAEGFLESTKQAEAAVADYQPGKEAQAMIKKGVSPLIAIHLEQMKCDPTYGRQDAINVYRSL